MTDIVRQKFITELQSGTRDVDVLNASGRASFSCDADVNSSRSPWMNSFGFFESSTAR